MNPKAQGTSYVATYIIGKVKLPALKAGGNLQEIFNEKYEYIAS